jgi:hypothetical protein
LRVDILVLYLDVFAQSGHRKTVAQLIDHSAALSQFISAIVFLHCLLEVALVIDSAEGVVSWTGVEAGVAVVPILRYFKGEGKGGVEETAENKQK